MRGGKKAQGYTILEVMIVLAVSGVMFVIASTFVAGKQASTAFTQGVNSMASQLQKMSEDVSNGKYTDIRVNCDFTAGNVSFPPLVGVAQGTNSSCVYLGKVVHFVNGGNRDEYEVFSVAGGRVNASGDVITTLSASDPTVVSALTAHEIVPQRLSINRIDAVNASTGATVNSYGVGVIQGLGSPDASGQVKSGVQPVSLYYVNGMGDNLITPLAAAAIDAPNSLVLASSIAICISDGTRYAVLSLNNGNALNVDVSMRGRTAC